MNILDTDQNVYKNAIGKFFGFKPANRFWILLVFFLSKRHLLKKVNNYVGEDIVLATITPSFLSKDERARWEKTGIKSCSIVVLSSLERDLDAKILEIAKSIEEDEKQVLTEKKRKRETSINNEIVGSTLLFDIAESFISLSDEWFDSFGLDAFDALLYRCCSEDEKTIFQALLPEEFDELFAWLIGKQGGSIYNPDSMACTICRKLEPEISFIGNRSDGLFAAGMLTLLMHNRKNYSFLHKEIDDKNQIAKYDYLLSVLPFSRDVEDEENPIEDLDRFASLVANCQKKALVLCPTSYSFQRRIERTKQFYQLVKNGYLETVILFPFRINNIFFRGVTLFVFNKDNPHPQYVRFIDGQDSFLKNRTSESFRIFPILHLLNLGTNSNMVKNVSVKMIENNHWILFPRFYTCEVEMSEQENFRILSLKDFLEPIYKVSSRGKVGDTRHLANFSRRSSSLIIDANSLELSDLRTTSGMLIVEDCLVASFDWSSIVYLTNVKDVPIEIRSSQKAFRFKTEEVLPEYFLGEIRKEYFRRQFDRFRIDNIGQAHLSNEDFLSFRILIPTSKESQKDTILEEKRTQLDSQQAELEIEYREKLNDFILNQRQRKHAVAQVLNEILPTLDLLNNYIADHASLRADSIVSSRRGITFSQYFASLRQQVGKIASMVDNFTSMEKFHIIEEQDLKAFLASYCASKVNENYETIFTSEFPNPILAKFSHEDMSQLLDNLFANASKHGFVIQERKDYCIRVSLKDARTNFPGILVCIANNGDPVPEYMTEEKIFAWGIGEGSGIGCWQAREIARNFNGNIHYNSCPEDKDGFCTEFEIWLPVNFDSYEENMRIMDR